jgi:hypothetical protein
MTFTDDERAILRAHELAVYRDKLILEAQPPISDDALTKVGRFVAGSVPDDLTALWRTAFGGALDYDLQVAFGEHEYSTSFSELFYPESSQYRDLFGWIEHELELASEAAENDAVEHDADDEEEGASDDRADDDRDDSADGEPARVERLTHLPFGGFEYLERMYCVTSGPELGSVYLWARALPPAWRELTEDSVVQVSASVAELFDQLSLDDDPWSELADGSARGLEMKSAIEQLRPEHAALAGKLQQLVQRSIFDVEATLDAAALQSNAFGAPHAPAVKRALILSVCRACAKDEPQPVQRLLANGCPLSLRVRAKTTILPYAIARGAYAVAAAALASRLPLAEDPIVSAEGIPPELLDALIGRGVPFDAEAPLSIASAGDVASALRVANKAVRWAPDAWASLKRDVKTAAQRAQRNAKEMRSGKLSSYLTAEQYDARARHLTELAERLR